MHTVSYKCDICKDTGWVYTVRGTYAACKCQEFEKVKRFWEHSGVKVDQRDLTFSKYDDYDEKTKYAKNKAMKYVIDFNVDSHARENYLGLFGQPGAGKTHLVISIATNLINRKDNPVPVVYMPYLETMRELKANIFDDEYYQKLMDRYCRAKLLIIDDLFKDKVKNGELIKKDGRIVGLNESDMKNIYPILNHRYLNYLPTVISTECTPDMLLDLDEALAGRILECCGSNIVVFQGNKYNYRLRKFREVV